MTGSSFFSAEEEINNMKSELEKYGIQMPAFSKIGGILANELSVDEAARKGAFLGRNRTNGLCSLWLTLSGGSGMSSFAL